MNRIRRKKSQSPWSASLRAGVLAAILVAVAAPTLTQTASSAGGEPEPTTTRAGAPAQKEFVATTNVFRILRDGGIVMYPIALCSLVLLAFVFERTVSLRRNRIIPKPFVTRFLEQVREGQLDRSQAMTLCEESGSPVAEVFAAATRKWGRPAVEVEQAILDAGERVTNGLRRYLRVFSAISTVSPLLGLLGTVFGMIEAFNAVATLNALGRPELLAKGVSGALLTTAFGLVVAIPALLAYYFFVSRVDQRIIEIDALGQELVHLIAAEELQIRTEEGRTGKPRRTARQEAA